MVINSITYYIALFTAGRREYVDNVLFLAILQLLVLVKHVPNLYYLPPEGTFVANNTNYNYYQRTVCTDRYV